MESPPLMTWQRLCRHADDKGRFNVRCMALVRDRETGCERWCRRAAVTGKSFCETHALRKNPVNKEAPEGAEGQ